MKAEPVRTTAADRAYLRELETMPIERRRRAEVATMQHAILFLLLPQHSTEWSEAMRILRRLVREFDADGDGYWYDLRVQFDRYVDEANPREQTNLMMQMRRAALSIYSRRATSALSAWSECCDDSLRLVEPIDRGAA